MDPYKPRKIKFKAWNLKTKLMMRLNSIDCVKGELFKQDHILLQFTGFLDLNDDEIYEQDVLFLDGEKYVVCWEQGWCYRQLNGNEVFPLQSHNAGKMSRLCSHFEMERK